MIPDRSDQRSVSVRVSSPWIASASIDSIDEPISAMSAMVAPAVQSFSTTPMEMAVPELGPERVERPVLQKDVDGSPEGGGAGGHHCGGVELVVGAAEEHDRQGLVIHRRQILMW